MENIDLKKLSAEQLCDLFNDETAQVKHWDIIQEFIDRKISTVNIQRASGSMNGRPMRIWYNEGRNCIEVRGRVFFDFWIAVNNDVRRNVLVVRHVSLSNRRI